MLGGELIYQTSDEYGDIEVIDYFEKIRALHFGNKTHQSASLLCNPYFLIHKYAQAMLLPLCWLKPKSVLVLGLGAGSITKYLYNYHPDIVIDAVELRKKVIDVATQFFMLPDPDKRLNIYNNSVANWLKNSSTKKYDLIIVDVFLTSSTGTDITVDISSSFKQLDKLLSNTGVAVFNYLGDNIEAYPGYIIISEIFKPHLYSLNIESTNSLIIASRRPVPSTINNDVFNKLSDISSLPYKEYFQLLKSI